MLFSTCGSSHKLIFAQNILQFVPNSEPTLVLAFTHLWGFSLYIVLLKMPSPPHIARLSQLFIFVFLFYVFPNLIQSSLIFHLTSFSVPGSHLGYHVTFGQYVFLGSSGLLQFLRLIFLLKVFQFGPRSALSGWLLCSFDIPSSFCLCVCEHFIIFWHYQKLILYMYSRPQV